MNTSAQNWNPSTLRPPAAATTQTAQARPIMVPTIAQPQAMLPISSSVANSNPPIDFTSLQPPPIEATLMGLTSNQGQQILQGKYFKFYSRILIL